MVTTMKKRNFILFSIICIIQACLYDTDVLNQATRLSNCPNDLTLSIQNKWWNLNRVVLTNVINTKGCISDSYDSSNKPIAIFDFDDTLIKNSLTEALFNDMVDNNRLHTITQWSHTSSYLSAAAIVQLTANCGASLNQLNVSICKTTLKCVYNSSLLNDSNQCTALGSSTPPSFSGHPAPKPAFSVPAQPRTTSPAIAWALALQAGYTPQQIKDMTIAVWNTKIQASDTTDDFIRIYEHSKELISFFSKYGFDIWISSPSSQYIIEAVADKFNVPSNQIIGTRPIINAATGTITTRFEGCGNIVDGQDIINARDGQRCWFNKIAHKLTKDLITTKVKNLAFMMGASSNTVTLFGDAEYRLVIHKHDVELMCIAYADQVLIDKLEKNRIDEFNKGQPKGGPFLSFEPLSVFKWMINPMFIKPYDTITTSFISFPDLIRIGAPPISMNQAEFTQEIAKNNYIGDYACSPFLDDNTVLPTTGKKYGITAFISIPGTNLQRQVSLTTRISNTIFCKNQKYDNDNCILLPIDYIVTPAFTQNQLQKPVPKIRNALR